MTNKVRQSDKVKGIDICNNDVGLSQFADDTNLFCEKCAFSGLRLDFKSGNPEISSGSVQNEKKSKIPKLCQDTGLDELFLEKIL